MLAALLFLGLLPFAALPMMHSFESGDQGLDGDQADTPAAAGDMLDDIGISAVDGPEADPEPGETYALDARPGETVYDGFEMGVDFIEVDLTEIDGDLHFDTLSDEEGSTVSFGVSENGVSTLHFPGLADLPAGDISLTLSDATTGAPFHLFLSDAMSGSVDTVSSTAEIGPSDPDALDEPGPVVDEETVVDPLDPETPDDPGPGVEGPVLDPTVPDDQAFGTEGDPALRDLLERDDLAVAGLGDVLGAASESGTVVTELGSGDDSFALANDAVTGTGDGELAISEGSPVLTATDPLQVVDGGAGNDAIAAGDSAAYVFGAASGDDLIDGAAGDDLIRGGAGADTLIGGDGNDVIDHMGRHEEREIIQHHEFDWHIDGDADVLSGGAGDDTLILDRADTAEGGEGQDLFWVYFDGAELGGAAEITDFAVGEDFLRVSLNPNIGENDDPEVQVMPSEDGLDGLVFVNGDLVAVLLGAPTATVSDVYAEVKADVFP